MKLHQEGITYFKEPIDLNDLSSMDESLFDYDYPIYLTNPTEDNEINTANYRILVKAVEMLGGDTNRLFNELYKRHRPEIMTHPKRFISSKDAIFFHDCVRRLLAENGVVCASGSAYNPRFHMELGHIAGKYQSMGKTLDFLAQFVPMKKVYPEAVKYCKYFNNTELYKCVFNRNNTAIIIHKYFENLRDNRDIYRFTQNNWSQGIIAGIPAARGLEPADSSIDYCLFSLFEVLNRDFEYLNLDLSLFSTKQDEVNGVRRNHYFYGNKEFAHDVFLEKMVISQERKRIGGKKILYDHEVYDIVPKEFEAIQEESIKESLANKKIAQVQLITSDIAIDNETVFEKTEMYNAPYTRFTFKYPTQSGLQNVARKMIRPAKILFSYQGMIDKELAATRDEAMRATREAQIARKNEAVAIGLVEELEKAKATIEDHAQNLETKVEERTKELRQTQAKLIETEKRTLEHRITGGFAHEMRNALSGAQLEFKTTLNYKNQDKSATVVLKNSATTLLKNISRMHEEYSIPREKIATLFLPQLKTIAEIADHLSEVHAGVSSDLDRGLSITSQIREYARMSEFKKGEEPIDVVALLKEYENRYKQDFERIGISYSVEDLETAVVKADETHMNSIFSNLILNARDALEEQDAEGKAISVKVERVDEAGVKLLKIKIEDNGPGIPEEQINEIFEPFFSTKPTTGTGLGLGIVKRLAQLYGGKIELDSKVGEGTIFSVGLPCEI